MVRPSQVFNDFLARVLKSSSCTVVCRFFFSLQRLQEGSPRFLSLSSISNLLSHLNTLGGEEKTFFCCAAAPSGVNLFRLILRRARGVGKARRTCRSFSIIQAIRLSFIMHIGRSVMLEKCLDITLKKCRTCCVVFLWQILTHRWLRLILERVQKRKTREDPCKPAWQVMRRKKTEKSELELQSCLAYDYLGIRSKWASPNNDCRSLIWGSLCEIWSWYWP